MKHLLTTLLVTGSIAILLTGCNFHLTTASSQDISAESLLDGACAMPVISSKGILNCIITSGDENVPFSASISSLESGTLSEASGRVAASMPGKSINKDYHIFTETVGDITTIYQYDPDAKALSKETKEDIPEWVKYSRVPSYSPVRELFNKDVLINSSVEETDNGYIVHADLDPAAFPSVLGGIFGNNEIPSHADYLFSKTGQISKISVTSQAPSKIQSEEEQFTISDLEYNITIISTEDSDLKFTDQIKAAKDTEIRGMMYPMMILTED